MKAQRPYPQITITPKGEAALVGGHPWVYEGEVTGLSGPVSDGQLVDVTSRRGSWLGCGFFNSRSRIRVRVLSRNPNDRFDRAFWRRRIQYAWDYRKTVMGPEDSRCCRVIFGEADGFPGLTVDRFESVLVAQVLCLGMELIKEELFSLLSRDYISGITFSGGDPLYTGNREEIERLARKVKLEYPEKNIWLYTGYRWEEISALPLMQYIDVLVDGKFIADLKDTKLHWKGSFNQRIIDVQKSLQSSSLYLYHAE